MKKIAAQFLNVDLDLKSSADPSTLVKAWTNRVLSIHLGKNGRRHWVRFELAAQISDPAQVILRFCRLVQRLNHAERVVWNRASSREFDIGLQAGLEWRAAEWVLHPTVIRAVRDVDARIRITVYSPLALLEEEKRRMRRRAGIQTTANIGTRIVRVVVNAESAKVYLSDGRMIAVPIASSWRLSHATRAQRANWQLIGKGKRIYWPDIDEDLSLENLLEGIPVRRPRRESADVQRSANQALQPTSRTFRTGKSRRRSRAARG